MKKQSCRACFVWRAERGGNCRISAGFEHTLLELVIREVVAAAELTQGILRSARFRSPRLQNAMGPAPLYPAIAAPVLGAVLRGIESIHEKAAQSVTAFEIGADDFEADFIDPRSAQQNVRPNLRAHAE